MKKIILFALIISAFQAHAQQMPTTPNNIDPQNSQAVLQWAKAATAQIFDLVQLTAEQESNVHQLNLQIGRRMEILASNVNLSPEIYAQEKNDLLEIRLKQYNKFLTPQQQALLLENKEKIIAANANILTQ